FLDPEIDRAATHAEQLCNSLAAKDWASVRWDRLGGKSGVDLGIGQPDPGFAAPRTWKRGVVANAAVEAPEDRAIPPNQLPFASSAMRSGELVLVKPEINGVDTHAKHLCTMGRG